MTNDVDAYVAQARSIIDSIQYLTIATVNQDGTPWNSPVHQVHDEQYIFYWLSDKNNQHSKNIRANGKVFGVIYDSTVPEGEGVGIYLDLDVTEVDDAVEITKARRIKKGDDYVSTPGEFLGDAVRRVYRAVPTKIWINDAEIVDGVFVRDFKVSVPIEMLRGEQ